MTEMQFATPMSDFEVMELSAKLADKHGAAAVAAAWDRAHATFVAWRQASEPGDDVSPLALILLELRRALDEKVD